MMCLLNGILIGMYYYIGELNTSLAWVVTTIWMFLYKNEYDTNDRYFEIMMEIVNGKRIEEKKIKR